MKDYLLLLDGNEKLKRIINAYEFYDDELKSTTTGERVLTFKMNDSVVDIENGNKIGVFIEGKFDLFIVDQVEAETYYSTSIKVTCLHDFYSIQTQKAITQYYKESVSVHDAMTEMLKGTSYELGECVERSLIPIGPYLFKNPLWCIQDIISNFGVEINYSIELNETRTGIARKLVHVVNALGSDTGIRCSTDLNVSKIKRIEKDKFYTVMYGCGAEYQKDLVKYKYDFKDISWSTSNGNPTDKPAGQEFVEDKKAIAKYGRIIGIFEDGRIKDPELLLKKTWEALQKNNRPIVSYELDIEELKTEDGYEHLNFKLGDIIILQNTIDNSRAKFRIVEDCVSVRNKNKRKVTVGEQIKGIFSGGNSGNSDGTEGPGGSVIDPGGEEIKPPSLEEITPDTLPAVPIVTAKGLWGKVMLSWTYENKMYYNYEVYASRIKDFEPIVFNMIYSGKASAFLHEAGADETWYYRVRAVNTFGNSTEFSEQVEAKTTKVADGTEYFETAAIKDALIEELRLDRGWIGQLDATYLKVKGKFTVTDGNDTETFKIDSFGRMYGDFSEFTIKGKAVAQEDWVNVQIKNTKDGIIQTVEDNYATKTEVTQAVDSWKVSFEQPTNNIALNSNWNKSIAGWFKNGYPEFNVTESYRWINHDRNTLWLKNSTDQFLGLFQPFETIVGKTYTFVLKYMNDGGYQTGAGTVRFGIENLSVLNRSASVLDGWRTETITFTATKTSHVMIIYLAHAAIYAEYCQLIDGDVTNGIPPWTPAPNEILNSSTEITQDGILVNNGKIRIKNHEGTDVFWVDQYGQLCTDNIFIYGAEKDANLEIGGTGNKGIGIRSSNGGERYIDFCTAPRGSSWDQQLDSGTLTRLYAKDGDFWIMPTHNLNIQNCRAGRGDWRLQQMNVHVNEAWYAGNLTAGGTVIAQDALRCRNIAHPEGGAGYVIHVHCKLNLMDGTTFSSGVFASVPRSSMFFRTLTEKPLDVLDSIEFIDKTKTPRFNLFMSLPNEEEAIQEENTELLMDVSNIVGTPYASIDENGSAIASYEELLKLALKEIKGLKERVIILEGK